MDDPAAMRAVQSGGNLHAEAKRLLQGERALLQALGERLSLEKLENQVIDSLLTADVVKGANVGIG
jgi:hypothetical protein